MKVEYEKLADEVYFKRYTMRTGNLHWHENAELIRIAKGFAKITVANSIYDMKQGDIIFVQSKQLHYFETNSDGCVVDLCMISPIFLNKWLSKLFLLSTNIPYEKIKDIPGLEQEINFIISVLIRESENITPLNKEILEVEILHLWCILARHFSTNINLNSKKLDFLYTVLDYIDKNYSEPLSLSSVAKKCNYSPAYLSSLFSECLGIGFKKYLDQVRVAESKKLMISTDLSITSIALSCGFDNVRTFNNRFKSITEITPSEFIAQFSKGRKKV